MGELGQENAKLEFQYKTVLDLGKFMYDAYFKLAAMSFTLDGLLLGSVSFFLPQAEKIPQDLYLIGIKAVGVIGFIYNFGALFTYLSLVSLTQNLAGRFADLDQQLRLGVSSCRTSRSDTFGFLSILLTGFFFFVWIVVWVYVILKIPASVASKG
jgi:hypothetical protein